MFFLYKRKHNETKPAMKARLKFYWCLEVGLCLLWSWNRQFVLLWGCSGKWIVAGHSQTVWRQFHNSPGRRIGSSFAAGRRIPACLHDRQAEVSNKTGRRINAVDFGLGNAVQRQLVYIRDVGNILKQFNSVFGLKLCAREWESMGSHAPHGIPKGMAISLLISLLLRMGMGINVMRIWVTFTVTFPSYHSISQFLCIYM